MIRRPVAFLSAILVLNLTGAPAFGQQRGANPSQQQQQQPPTTRGEQAEQAQRREETAGPNEEKISQTSHTVRLDGHDIKYTATAGTLPIRSEDGKVAA
ncbi:MAG TPA: hypothetical protein VGF24_09235, partial [Vicinamibacterales bacterium]